MAISDWFKNLFKASSFQGTVYSDPVEGDRVDANVNGLNISLTANDARAIDARIAAAHSNGMEYYPTMEESRVLVARQESALPPGQITEHFSWAEAMCNSGEPVPEEYKQNAREVAELLELIRELFGGRPVKPNSWYRSKARNEALKKAAIAAGRSGNVATKSQHLTASAADINVRGIHPRVLQDVLESIWLGHGVLSMDVFEGKWTGPLKPRGLAICREIHERMRGLGRLAHRGAVHVDVRKGKRAIFNYK